MVSPTIFSDAGQTQAQPGDTVALVLDTKAAVLPRRNAEQPNAALQPKYGSAPKEVRNLLGHSEDLSRWNKTRVTVEAAGDNGWKVVSDTASDSHFVSLGCTETTRAMVEAKPAGYSHLKFTVKLAGGAFKEVYYDLSQGTVGSADGGLTGSISATSDGFYECLLVSDTPFVGVFPEVAGDGENTQHTGDGISGLYIRRASAGEEGPYQKTSNDGLLITDPEATSYGFLRHDGVDDKLTTTFPDGLNGDVFLAGRGGCWVEEGVSIPAGGTLDVGPVDGPKTPGIIRAVGGENIDLLAALPIGRTLSGYERRKLAQYFRDRGGKGLLVPDGVERLADPNFDTGAGWDITSSGGWTFGNGVATAVTSEQGEIFQDLTLQPGACYIGKYTVVRQDRGNVGHYMTGDAAGGAAYEGTALGTFVGVFAAVSPTGSYRLRPNNGGCDIDIGSASFQRLVPQEDL